jgi:hypothetical protein
VRRVQPNVIPPVERARLSDGYGRRRPGRSRHPKLRTPLRCWPRGRARLRGRAQLLRARRRVRACAESLSRSAQVTTGDRRSTRRSPAPRLDTPSNQLVARGRPGRSKRRGPTKRRERSSAVGITVALSRERRERAPDESLLPASRDRRLECSGVKTFEHARPLVRRSPAAAQCYTARRTRPPHRRRR